MSYNILAEAYVRLYRDTNTIGMRGYRGCIGSLAREGQGTWLYKENGVTYHPPMSPLHSVVRLISSPQPSPSTPHFFQAHQYAGQLYPEAAPWALTWAHRLPLMMKEVAHWGPDVVCLQV